MNQLTVGEIKNWPVQTVGCLRGGSVCFQENNLYYCHISKSISLFLKTYIVQSYIVCFRSLTFNITELNLQKTWVFWGFF